MTGIVHSRWLGSLMGLFPTTCTVESPADTNTKGDIIKAPWSAVPGLSGLRGRISPANPGHEVRGADQTYTIVTHLVTLPGYYPTIQPRMRITADGQSYEIEAITHDGNNTMTRLFTRRLQA